MGLDLTLPTSDTEFDEMMKRVDDHLRDQGASPPQRPLRAFLTVSSALGLGLKFTGTEATPRPGVFIGTDMTARIFAWYDSHYGSRLEMRFGPGRVVLTVRQELWFVSFPMIMGEVRLVADPNRTPVRSQATIGKTEAPVHNVLDDIQDLPDDVRRSLSEPELREFLQVYVEMMYHLVALQRVIKVGMCEEVASDIDAAAAHLLGEKPHCGSSKWSSLQAVEKILKTYTEAQGVSFSKSHVLTDLAAEATAAGMLPLQAALVSSVQCSASVRYGEELVSMCDAHLAHQASVRIVGAVAQQL